MIGSTITMDTSNVLTTIAIGVTAWLCKMVMDLRTDGAIDRTKLADLQTAIGSLSDKVDTLPCKLGACREKKKP